MRSKILEIIFSFAILAQACNKNDTSLKIAGSDTMVQLAQNLARTYMQHNPGKAVSVQGGGSGTGMAALLNGSADIASASREMKPKEWAIAKAKGLQIREYVLALDALAIVVHPSNIVSKLTIPQLSDIYAGKITNWKELGGSDLEILAISRENNSGTHVYFKEKILRQGKKANQGEKNPDPLASIEFGTKVTFGVSSQAIADQVKTNKAAIGYFGMGWTSKGVKIIKVSGDGQKYFDPTPQNTKNRKYPIARGMQMYLNAASGSKEQNFIDFVMSPSGQAVVKAHDFVPVN